MSLGLFPLGLSSVGLVDEPPVITDSATVASGEGVATGSGSGGDATGGGGSNATVASSTGSSTGSGSGGDAIGGASSSGTFTTDVLTNNTGSIVSNTNVIWSWWKGAIGTPPTSITNGTGITDGSGTLTATGLPVGSGFILITNDNGSMVFYQPGTIT